MYSFIRSGLVLVFAVAVSVGVTTLPTRAADGNKALKGRVKDLEAKVAAFEATLQYVHVEQGPINGLAGPHVIFEGCNVHLRSGSGNSVDGTVDLVARAPIEGVVPTGLGNLIIGYDEDPLVGATARGASHNLVIGPGHNFTSVSGAVIGQQNRLTGPMASVTSGFDNEASRIGASVSGGLTGKASGKYSSVTGGANNTASATFTSVNGGSTNLANSGSASIAGGYKNTASGDYACVGGGTYNKASAYASCVSGGGYNTASESTSSVSGDGYNTASHYWSTVRGGIENTAAGNSSTVGGGNLNIATGANSTVGGGYSRTATGTFDWVAGNLFAEE